ncbi:hypothetical protein C8F01DRAFT_1089554 [Mycena amicta]|nr:hypothetical protein C8F01DRAFT_1089554 [Mycena amicta]
MKGGENDAKTPCQRGKREGRNGTPGLVVANGLASEDRLEKLDRMDTKSSGFCLARKTRTRYPLRAHSSGVGTVGRSENGRLGQAPSAAAFVLRACEKDGDVEGGVGSWNGTQANSPVRRQRWSPKSIRRLVFTLKVRVRPLYDDKKSPVRTIDSMLAQDGPGVSNNKLKASQPYEAGGSCIGEVLALQLGWAESIEHGHKKRAKDLVRTRGSKTENTMGYLSVVGSKPQ